MASDLRTLLELERGGVPISRATWLRCWEEEYEMSTLKLVNHMVQAIALGDGQVIQPGDTLALVDGLLTRTGLAPLVASGMVEVQQDEPPEPESWFEASERITCQALAAIEQPLCTYDPYTERCTLCDADRIKAVDFIMQSEGRV